MSWTVTLHVAATGVTTELTGDVPAETFTIGGHDDAGTSDRSLFFAAPGVMVTARVAAGATPAPAAAPVGHVGVVSGVDGTDNA